MRIHRIACAALVALVASNFAPAASSAELPGDYFKLMSAELERVEPAPELEFSRSYLLAAAVLYAKEHPRNPAFGQQKLFDLAVALGDVAALQSEQDDSRNRQDYEWEIHGWLDAYRLLESKLGPERRGRWRKELERNVRWFAENVAPRVDFPRYQSPFLGTSPNHYALWASTVHLAGRVFQNKEWEQLGGRVMHRFAAEEQTPDGYWGEFTDNGPTTGYNYITMCCVALYHEHSGDAAALEALRRATDFHKHFTWPDGRPVVTIDGRSRDWGPSVWGHFGFTHWPDGRGYAEFLSRFFQPGLRGRDLGRLAQTVLYYHDGPAEPAPQTLSNYDYRMNVEAGIRRAGPWSYCLSGLFDPPRDNRFHLRRQGNLSVFHDRLGLIITGANSRDQPELATIMEKQHDVVTTVPRIAKLRMSDEGDRLSLSHRSFFVDLHVPPPRGDRLTWRFDAIAGGDGRMQEGYLNLQLVLHAGEVLETAKTKVTLGEESIELGPEEIGGWIRHSGWKLEVDPTARLTWPVHPFSPYHDGPHPDLDRAVGRLAVPLDVKPPAYRSGENWPRQEIAFTLRAEETAEE
ncbi:MAG: hypothetical protein WD069_10530 [Planctomycetales bacterium]